MHIESRNGERFSSEPYIVFVANKLCKLFVAHPAACSMFVWAVAKMDGNHRIDFSGDKMKEVCEYMNIAPRSVRAHLLCLQKFGAIERVDGTTYEINSEYIGCMDDETGEIY